LKIDRLAQLPKYYGAKILVIVDDLDNVQEIFNATKLHGTFIEILVEIDCGHGRCGVSDFSELLKIVQCIHSEERKHHIKFSGIQAYQGLVQHVYNAASRFAKAQQSVEIVKNAVDFLAKSGFQCELVTGGGTGSYVFDGNSGVYNEIQCGSYAFMDADYGKVETLDEYHETVRLDYQSQFEVSLFILTSITSKSFPQKAICDAGLKVQSVDSGLPVVYGMPPEIQYLKASDEHGTLSDPNDILKINQKIRLIPGHCDPTCNCNDWYCCVRNGKVENVWAIDARGKSL
jgi:3-hydroxy-D-aspartate aldolase